jgi:acyl-CoA synthetase (AMP-forming)/AMP-acid ligase II
VRPPREVDAVKSSDYRILGDAVRTQAALRPDAVALIYQDRRSTYASLDAAANRLANALLDLGIQKGDRVCILAKNSDRYLECIFGASRARAVITPINWRLAPAEIEYILNDSHAKILFVDADLMAGLNGVDCSHLTHRIVLDGAAPGGLDYETLTARAAPSDPGLEVSLQDVVMQIYTSGTTGRPKGAMLTNANFLKICDLEGPPTPAWFQMQSSDVSIVAVPQFHIGGVETSLRPLFGGATLIIHREFDPASVLGDIEAFGVTVIALVPTALQMVIEHPNAERTDFSSIRTLFYGASPIPLDLLRESMRVVNCDFVQAYGMTETTGTIVTLPPADHSPEGTPRMRSAGKPLPGVELKVVDGKGAALGPHQVGEIVVRTRSVMCGYWGMPEATAATIDAEGWLSTGDAGYLDEDGYIYIHDRVKDMIVSGAENIYPAEVENAIFGHPQVAEVAVIGVPDPKWGEAVKAVIVPRPGEVIDEGELLTWVRTRIAGYKVPRSIDIIEELPHNATGKVLKTELRKPYWAGYTRAVN